ncbi:OmpA family protein [Parasulfuritortus cantonensis]|nr:OmpA family protein [Parasulfuritortus cantonensis]
MTARFPLVTALLAAVLAGCASQPPGQDAALFDRVGALERQVAALSEQMKEALAFARQDNLRVDGREAFVVRLSGDGALYPLNAAEPAGADIERLDDLVRHLADVGPTYHLEVQGHADNIGPDDYNYALAKARAEAVVRYLHERKGIPLSRMSVISYGAGEAGRDAKGNGRIVIRVLVPK